MNWKRNAMTVILLAAAAGASARDTRHELNVSLRFTPQEGVQSTSPDLPSSVTDHSINVRIEDARGGDSAVVGQGTNDDDVTFPIRATTDVVSFVNDSIHKTALQWGLRSAERPDRVLTLKLTRFYVEESNKAVGSVYAAEVKVAFELADASGHKLLDGATSGSAHRYGRARSGDNCNEVLSDSLKEAFANVLSDPQVQRVWAEGRPGGDSIEERLKKLEELYEKHLITKEDYDKRRAEILKDV